MKSTKKSKAPEPSPMLPLMKPFLAVVVIAGIGIGAYSLWEANPNVRSAITQYIDNGEIQTFEVRYTPEKVLELHGAELLSNGERTFQKADLKFQPHALFDVKYSSQDKKTREGVLLWSLVDGEMVINCDKWEKSHGFEDAINAQANRNDFKMLQALEKANGKLPVAQLQKELQVEEDLFHSWLENAKEKHLIVQQGNEVQLHFQNPRLLVMPQTKLSQCLVSKPYNHAQKISRRYSISQLEKLAQAAFGQDFKIRSQEVVYLPIYNIDILNPDGSTRTVEVNAVTGEVISPRYL